MCCASHTYPHLTRLQYEANSDLQRRSARAVATFVDLCGSTTFAKTNPSDKIVKNLCAFLCQDTTRTLVFEKWRDTEHHIITLFEQNQIKEKEKEKAKAKAKQPDLVEDVTVDQEQGNASMRRGAYFALEALAAQFGETLLDRLPQLHSCMLSTLTATFSSCKTRHFPYPIVVL